MGRFTLATGIPIDKVALLDQETRNYIGKKLLELTLMELFVFRFMQACHSTLFFNMSICVKLLNVIVDSDTLTVTSVIQEFKSKYRNSEV
jgi:hypothetical protein